MKRYVDVVFVYNLDKHCDVDGWFVDKAGNHRTVLREYKEDRLDGPKYSEFEISEYYF